MYKSWFELNLKHNNKFYWQRLGNPENFGIKLIKKGSVWDWEGTFDISKL